MNLEGLNLKGLLRKQKVVVPLCLIGIFFLHTTFVFGSDKEGGEEAQSTPASMMSVYDPSENGGMSQTKEKRERTSQVTTPEWMFGRVPTVPFRDDVIYDIRLGYGLTIYFDFPEKIKSMVSSDERLVSADWVEDKGYVKGIAYSVGESTNVHANFESGKTMTFFIRIVEPAQSQHRFKFIVPDKRIFSESHVKNEVEKATQDKEEDLERREGNLEEVTEKLAEERIKQKLLHEEKKDKKVQAKKNDLEVKDAQVTHLGSRVYVKFTLRNRSKKDFSLGTILLGRGITDPNNSKKVLGVEDLQVDSPTLESDFIRAGGQTKALLAFDARQVTGTDKAVLRVVEDGGEGRSVEFKNLKLFTR